jgi:hypothetical protein
MTKLMNPNRSVSTQLTLLSWTMIFIIACHFTMLFYQGVIGVIFGTGWLGFLVNCTVVIPIGTFGIALPVREFKHAQHTKMYLPRPRV